MDDAVAETVDYVALCRLQRTYADVVSRKAWAELSTVFLPETTLTLDLDGRDPRVFTGPGEIGGLIARHVDPLDHFTFVILNTVVAIGVGDDPDVAHARTYICEIRCDPRSGGRRDDLFGVYHDRVQRVAGRWWFTERRFHRTATTGPGLLTWAFPPSMSDFV